MMSLQLIKNAFVGSFLLISFSLFAQENLFFSPKYATTVEEAKYEISNVIKNVTVYEEEMKMNEKVVACDGEYAGFTGWVYSLDGVVREIEIPAINLGVNGRIRLYYNYLGNLGLVVEESADPTRYHLLGINGKTWHFVENTEVTFPNDESLEKETFDGAPLYKKIVQMDETDKDLYEELFLDINENSYREIKKRITEKARKLAIVPEKMRYFSGTVAWKFPIRMELNFDKGGVLSGRYKYKISKADIAVSGNWTEERFQLTETVNGEVTGQFKGRFVNRTDAHGSWYNAKGEKKHDFEFSLTDSYAFPTKPNPAYLITNAQVGVFKTGESFPAVLPAGFTSETEEKVVFDEGMRYSYYVTNVKKDGKKVLTCSIEENRIMEIEISDLYATPEGIRVGSMLKEFSVAYPFYSIWYSYVGDIFVIEDGENGPQFLIDEKYFLGKKQNDTDKQALKLTDFEVDAVIKSILVR